MSLLSFFRRARKTGSLRSAKSLEKIAKLRREGNFDQAIEAMESLQKEHPKDLDILQDLVLLFMEARRYEEVLAVLKPLALSDYYETHPNLMSFEYISRGVVDGEIDAEGASLAVGVIRNGYDAESVATLDELLDRYPNFPYLAAMRLTARMVDDDY